MTFFVLRSFILNSIASRCQPRFPRIFQLTATYITISTQPQTAKQRHRSQATTTIMTKRKITTTRVARTTAESVLEEDDLEPQQAPNKRARNGDITPILSPELDAPEAITEKQDPDEFAGSAVADPLQTPTKRGRGSIVLARVADIPASPTRSPLRRSTRAKRVDYGEHGNDDVEESVGKGKRTKKVAKIETEELEEVEQTNKTPKKARPPRKMEQKAAEEEEDQDGSPTPAPKKTRTPRKRVTKKTAEVSEEVDQNDEEVKEEEQDRSPPPTSTPKKTRTPRKRVTKKTTEVNEAVEQNGEEIEASAKKTPKKTPRKRITKKTAEITEEMDEDGSDFAETPKKTPKRTPRKRATKKAADDDAFDGDSLEAPELGDSEVKPKRRRKKEKVVLTMEEEIALIDKDLEEMDRLWEADVKGELFPDKEPIPTAYNSTDDPLPFTGRLGFACLNTHLRTADPAVFCSRTCRLATLNAADSALIHAQQLGLANAWDLVKLIEWNEAHNIKFLRISSEMFPFASHPEHGYSLAFASEPLAKAGQLAAQWGHRLTTHPGQFTQLASPRPEVIRAAIADLKYHHELLSLLKLPPDQDKESVIILHVGGVFGDKQATLARFKETWATIPKPIQNRVVLENDDVCYSVHDILPICQELEIPLVFDWHHHNIVHDESLREGTLDVLPLLPVIADTWKPRGIKQKMHYSEPVPGSRGRDRRKHSDIVRFLPPGLKDVDLMVEAKGKERAVWGLMRRYGLGGWERKPGPDVVPVVIGKGKIVEDKEEKKKKKEVKEVKEVLVQEEEIKDDASESDLLSDQLSVEMELDEKEVKVDKED